MGTRCAVGGSRDVLLRVVELLPQRIVLQFELFRIVATTSSSPAAAAPPPAAAAAHRLPSLSVTLIAAVPTHGALLGRHLLGGMMMR